MKDSKVGKEDKDNLMLFFYEGDECDFEDPGDPDIIEITSETPEIKRSDFVKPGASQPFNSSQRSEPAKQPKKTKIGAGTDSDEVTELTPEFPEPVPTLKQPETSSKPIRFSKKVKHNNLCCRETSVFLYARSRLLLTRTGRAKCY